MVSGKVFWDMYCRFIFDEFTWKPYGLGLGGGTNELPSIPCATLLTGRLLETCIEFAWTTCTEPNIVQHNNMIIILPIRFI
ncbi:hypothetical protein ACT7C1_33890 [Bacillus paranthracis]